MKSIPNSLGQSEGIRAIVESILTLYSTNEENV